MAGDPAGRQPADGSADDFQVVFRRESPVEPLSPSSDISIITAIDSQR